MSVLSLLFRTVGAWGAGIGRRLTKVEVDTNFYNIKLAIDDLNANRPLPIGIASMERNGLELIVTLDNGIVFRLPWPVLQFHHRGTWAPFTVYLAADLFIEPGVGLFSVLVDHTSPAVFDRNLVLDGDTILNLIMPADSAALAISAVYDMGGCYQGVIKDSPETVLFEVAINRSLTIPDTTLGTLHRAHLREAPATARQIFTLTQNETHIGTTTFEVGSNTGVVDIPVAVNLVDGDIFGVLRPTTDDPVAALFSLLLAAART